MDEEVRFCALASCGQPLVQQPGETKQNWESRKTCGRRCAAIRGWLFRRRRRRAKQME